MPEEPKIQVIEYNLPLENYLIARIKTPDYQKDPILFPIHQKSLKKENFILETLKRKQVDEILENKHYRSQEIRKDIGIRLAAQDWFERFSGPLFSRYPRPYKLELSVIIICQDQTKTYTIIPSCSYIELRNQIQMPVLKSMPEEEQLRWPEKYSERFVFETLDSSLLHKGKKCYVFEDLEKRLEKAASAQLA